MRITLPASEFVSISYPPNKGAKTGYCYIPVASIPTNLHHDWLEINPRMAKTNKAGSYATGLAKHIVATIESEPELFSLRNRGIVIIANNFSYKGNTLTIELTDSANHGIADGGHTYMAIVQALDNARQSESHISNSGYVRLIVHVGLNNDDALQISDGNNRSIQVRREDLDNLANMYQHIQDTLDGHKYEKYIEFYYGQEPPRDIKISFLCAILESFNIDRWHGDTPAIYYRKKGLVANHYCADASGNKANPRFIKLIENCLIDILTLYGNISGELPIAYNSHGGRYGGLSYSTKRPYISPFTEIQSDYRPDSGHILPILSAFRANIEWGDSPKWKVDPHALYEKVKFNLARDAVGSGGAPSRAGSDPSTYRLCYRGVAFEVMSSNL